MDSRDCHSRRLDAALEGSVEVVTDEVDEMEKYWLDRIDGVSIWDFLRRRLSPVAVQEFDLLLLDSLEMPDRKVDFERREGDEDLECREVDSDLERRDDDFDLPLAEGVVLVEEDRELLWWTCSRELLDGWLLV